MYQKSLLLEPTMKVHLLPFKSGQMKWIEYNWLNLLPFGKMSSKTSLHPVKQIVIIVCFVSLAFRVLGIACVGDRANAFEDG
jgi:hypothetical protein